MASTEKRYVNLYVNGKGVAGTYNELRKEASKLRSELNGAKLTQEEFNKKVLQLKNTESAMAAHRASIKKTNKAWSTLKSVALGVVGGNVILGAFQKITQFIPQMIARNAELADSYADVRKTTGLTTVGIEQLNTQLRAIDTRTPRKRLLELARDAGKLGIEGVSSIAGFVKAADQIEVALGEDLGEGAITSLGKLNNLFKASDTYGYEVGLQKIGSVINELGANSEAAESAIVDFTSRLAGTAIQAEISYESIAGIGATLDSLGQRVETSSTAVSQAIVGMFKDTPTYAKVAGKSIEEFTEVLNKDANEAFIMFLEGLNGNNEGLTEMAKKFDDLGIDGSRAITVLGALAGNTAKLRDQQTLANKAFSDGTSLTAEFAIKNNNAAGALEKLGKRLAGVWINSDIQGAIGKTVGWLEKITRTPASKELNRQRIATAALITETVKLNVGSKERIEKIQQLKKEYPGLTSGINAETASNRELLAVMKDINAEYLRKALLAAKEDDLADQNEDMASAAFAANTALELANAQREKLLQGASDKEQEIFRVNEDAIIAHYRKIQATNANHQKKRAVFVQALRKIGISGLDQSDMVRFNERLKEYEGLQAKQVAAEKKFQATMDEISRIANRSKSGSGGLGTVDPDPTDPVDPIITEVISDAAIDSTVKKLEELNKLIAEDRRRLENSRLADYEKEIADIEHHYDELKAKAEGHTEQLLEIEALRRMALDNQKAAYEADKAAAQAEGDALLNGAEKGSLDAELAKTQELYQQQIEEFKKFGLDTLALEEGLQKALAQLRAKYADAATVQQRQAVAEQVSMYMEGAATIVGAIKSIADIQGKNAKFQADMAFFQQLVNAGLALSNAAASAKGITPIDYLAGLATVTVAIMARINAAKKMKEEAGAPPKPEFARGTVNTGAFIAGEQGREIIDGNRVIPADITQSIIAANAFSRPMPQPNFSAINDGLTYTQGRQAEQSSVGVSMGGMDISPLIAEMQAMREDLRNAQNKNVVFALKDYDKFRGKADANENRVVFRK